MAYTETRNYPRKKYMNVMLCEFVLQTDHLVPARRPDLVLIKKKKISYQLVHFANSADNNLKIK